MERWFIMMQTRHSSSRAVPCVSTTCSAALALLATEHEAAADLSSLQVPPLVVEPPIVPKSPKKTPTVKPNRFLDGVLGLASMIGEAETQEEHCDAEKDEAVKVKRKAPPAKKDHAEKKPKPAVNPPAKAERNGTHAPKGKSAVAKSGQQCLPFCKLNALRESLSSSYKVPTLSQSWDVFTRARPSAPRSEPSKPEAASEKTRKSTIHISIAFFIRRDLQQLQPEAAK